MKTPEDEAFDEMAKKQGSWGGGFQAKRAMAKARIEEDDDDTQVYKKPWVGLTDEDIHNTVGYDETREMYQFALALIAKLKAKNS